MARSLLLACLAALAGVALQTDYTAERALRVEVESTLEMETTSMEITRDGEPVDARGDMSSKVTHRDVHVDRVVAHEDGRPTKVRRSFEELEGVSSSSFGGEERVRESEVELEGVVLELELDEDGDVVARVVEGSEPSSFSALEGHALRLALDALLPEGEVEEGGTWDLEPEAIRRALGLDVAGALYPPPEQDEEGGGRRGGGRRGGFRGGGGGEGLLLQRAEWEGEATLSGEAELDGATVAVIAIEIEASGELEEPEGPGGRGGFALGVPSPRALETSYEIRLEGRLYFDRASRLPVLFELEGPVRIESFSERTFRDSTMVIESTREGTLEHRVSVKAE